MKNIIRIISVSALFMLAACKTNSTDMIAPALYKPEPNVLNKETPITIANDTKVTLPKGSFVKTDNDLVINAILEESVKIEVPVDSVKIPVSSVGPDGKTLPVPSTISINVPKNTPIILPPNTYLSMPDPTHVKVENETVAILPKGAEVTIAKVNWYAIAFYALIITGGIWYYMSEKWADQNNNGYEDNTEPEPKPAVNAQAQSPSVAVSNPPNQPTVPNNNA
jgi:hypothetical protein